MWHVAAGGWRQFVWAWLADQPYKARLTRTERPEVAARISQADPVRAAPEVRIMILDRVILPETDLADLVAAHARLGQSQIAAALTWVAPLVMHAGVTVTHA